MKTFKPGIYRHFKGNLYLALMLAKHSENLEDMVVYQALYGDRAIWVRPYFMWNEWIEHKGQKVQRFTYINQESGEETNE